MRKISVAIAAAIFAATSIFAIGVDEDEIRSVNQTIVFENYTGPHATVDTLDQIKQIGRGLGSAIASNLDSQRTAGNTAKYYVIHAIDSSVAEKLDADILVLGANASVDHIRNLRHIIAGYLSAAYNYSESDAQTIATFITVYNAVYRQNMDAFRSKYKDVVTNNLTASRAGLSTRYSEWPGNSQIVIPISDISGGLSTVDTSVISDREVINSMQEDDDKNIDARKDMVDIKEREAENANEKAQESQKTATEEQRKANEAQKQADQAQKQADQKKEDAQKAQQKADQAQKKADENPNDKQAQKEAQQAQKEADQAKKSESDAQKKADDAQQKADDAQKKADDAKKTASEQQAVADKKQSEAQEERRTIAQDQETVEKAEQAATNAPSVYGLSLASANSMDSAIVKVNTKDGTILQRSEVDVIKNRTMFPVGGGFLAVAGANSGNGAVKLVFIDEKSLEITKESEETLSDNSVLVQDGSNYLVIVKERIACFAAKYDSNLKLLKKSPVPVSPNSPIVKTSAGYMVTDVAGQPLVLDTAELKITTKQAVEAVTGTVKNLTK